MRLFRTAVFDSRVHRRAYGIVCAGAIGLLAPVYSASAQTSQTTGRLYVQGGFTGRTGDQDVERYDLNVGFTADAGPMTWGGLTATGGVWLTRRIGVEGEISRTSAQTFPWLFSYQFAETSVQQTSNRDVPIVGLVRLAVVPGRRMAVNAVVGAGVTSHRAHSYAIEDCGYGVVQLPCKSLGTGPVSDPTGALHGETVTSLEPAFEFGVDLPIHVSSRVAVAPTFRVLKADRRQWLTGFDHRGPQGGSGTLFIFGCSAVWGAR